MSAPYRGGGPHRSGRRGGRGPGVSGLPAPGIVVAAAGLTAGIGHLSHRTLVLVFTLAYGKDADLPTLQAIAKMTGTRYHDATDPATIEPTLGDLVTSF